MSTALNGQLSREVSFRLVLNDSVGLAVFVAVGSPGHISARSDRIAGCLTSSRGGSPGWSATCRAAAGVDAAPAWLSTDHSASTAAGTLWPGRRPKPSRSPRSGDRARCSGDSAVMPMPRAAAAWARMMSSVWPGSGSSSCMPAAAPPTWSQGNLPVRACRSRSRRRRYACRARKAHSNTRAQNAPIWDSLHRDELEPNRSGGSARGYLAVGGACQQSRYGLLDGRLFCIFIHRHPWGECPHLPPTGLPGLPRRWHPRLSYMLHVARRRWR
jgi:hypothetical protein